jgi:hypothetical protein
MLRIRFLGFTNSEKYFSYPLTARTNSVGYVVQTGVTTGKLFVKIVNENLYYHSQILKGIF